MFSIEIQLLILQYKATVRPIMTEALETRQKHKKQTNVGSK